MNKQTTNLLPPDEEDADDTGIVHPAEAQDTDVDPIIREWDPVHIEFPGTHTQPPGFARRFRKAMDAACCALDIRPMEDFLASEPYLAHVDGQDLLTKLGYRFTWYRDFGCERMETRDAWCAKCNPGLKGVMYFTTLYMEVEDRRIPYREDFSFLFREEAGHLTDLYECRMACDTPTDGIFN